MTTSSVDNFIGITRSRPYGHAAAVLKTLRKLGLDRILAVSPSPRRERVITLIAARIFDLDSISSVARARVPASCTIAERLAEMLDIEIIDEDDRHDAMYWLLQHQDEIERHLTKHHLRDGSLALYDITSIHLEEWDEFRSMQAVVSLPCNQEGCPVAVEVFEGDTADPGTLSKRIDGIYNRFGLFRVVLVNDRGMLPEPRIREEISPAGLTRVGALCKKAVRYLVISGAVQPSMFDKTDLTEIRSDAYPWDRLIVCLNKRSAFERKRRREELLKYTEKLLAPIVAATRCGKHRLKGKEEITLQVKKAIGEYRTGRFFELEITENSFAYRSNSDSIAAESALDVLYIVRTNIPAAEIGAERTVVVCRKNPSPIRRSAFHNFKTVCSTYSHDADRVRAYVIVEHAGLLR